MERLEQRLRNKTAKVGVIGLGYVGLPLAMSFAEAAFKVLGFDIQRKRVNQVNRGESYITDVDSDRLRAVIAKGYLEATTDQKRLQEVDAVCICVPTPLTKTKDPDLSNVIKESDEISKHLQRGQLVVLESTTYPGTTEGVVLPMLERSGLKCGLDFYLAYSLERVDPGNKKHTIRNIPKIVGGINSESTRLAELLYGHIVDSVISVSSPKVAEMTKVFENNPCGWNPL